MKRRLGYETADRNQKRDGFRCRSDYRGDGCSIQDPGNKGLNAQGCCLAGHPDYYQKFGLKNMAGLVHEGVPPEVFLALSFDGHTPQGIVTFHEGFKADGKPEGAGDALQHI